MTLGLLSAAAAEPTDPITFIIPAVVAFIVGILSYVGAQRAVAKAGENSDRALARTIEADRQGRLLERRYDLYARILAHAGERKQNRDVTVTAIKIEGWTPLDPYNPAEIFRLQAEAQAIADSAVLAAFVASNNAAEKVVRDWNYLQIAKGDPDYAKRFEVMFEHKELADVSDLALEAAIRASLHSS
jgi:hypothetical protein